MNCKEFVAAIDGLKVAFSRTNLATCECEDIEVLTPSDHYVTEGGHCGITLRGTTYSYSETDLFTHDHGMFVAVVLTGAGHLFCDRFVPAAS